jgi:branched-chain amino acid transport system substrate-binding protein
MSPRILNGKAITKMQAAVTAVIIIVAIIAGIAYYILTGPAPTPTPATLTPKTPTPATPTPATPTPATPTPATPTPATPTPATPTPATPTPATPTPLPLQGQILKIGLVDPLSGANAPFGVHAKRGLEMAVEEINAAGGILGAYVQLIVEDCAGDPKVSVTATEKLITVDKCQVIRGGFMSSVAAAMSEVTEKYEVPFVTTGGCAKSILEKGYKYIFRMPTNTTTFNEIAVDFLREVIKPKKVAIMHNSLLMGVENKDAFLYWVNKRGLNWEIVSIDSYDITSLDFKPLLQKIKSLNPDVLVIAGYLMDLALLSKQMVEIEFTPVVFENGGAGTQLLQLIDLSGEALKNWICEIDWWPDRQYPNATLIHQKSLEVWSRYGFPLESAFCYSYVGMYVVKSAVEKAKSLDPKKIRDAIATTEVNIPWYGPIKFYPNGQSTVRTVIVQVQDARANEPWQAHGLTYHTIWPPPYNSSTLIMPR